MIWQRMVHGGKRKHSIVLENLFVVRKISSDKNAGGALKKTA